MSDVLSIIKDDFLTYRQQLVSLANLAESYDTSLSLTDDEKNMKNDGILCDLFEGAAPYRPRYIIPDYRILMSSGSKFLGLDVPQDLWEACAHLMIMYSHVPSITTFPVYLGQLDELLEPFVKLVSYLEAKKCLRLFLLQIDRTLTDSFVHANIGPSETETGKILLELSAEMQCAVPNITLKYDPKLTSEGFATEAVKCLLTVAKPSFANHQMFTADWGEDYAIASCYNGLKIGGGGYTLSRLRLYECAVKAKNIDDFKHNVLPHYIDIMLKFMDKRIKFMVEESSFFRTNFLVKEGFVKREDFIGMFGIVGLAECCNHLLNITDKKNGYGHNLVADELGVEIVAILSERVNAHKGVYCEGCNDRYGLHAQVGIDSDGFENSPGVRIPVGVEPDLPVHIMHNTKYHKFFPTGVGSIFTFDSTWKDTPEALVDIVNGALSNGVRFFSGYSHDSDVVRVSGYLVKRSEIAKLDNKEQSIYQTTVFGQGVRDTAGALDRRVEKND